MEKWFKKSILNKHFKTHKEIFYKQAWGEMLIVWVVKKTPSFWKSSP